VIVASGGDFVTGMYRGRRDMATPYLREVLRFIGITNVLCAERTNQGPALRIRAAREAAHCSLAELAALLRLPRKTC
jgi:FMN-dependent NADH-azoreductase